MRPERLADLIAGRARVRVGGVEGILDGFTSQLMWLLVDGERIEVPAGEVVELEPLDEAAVAAHWAAVAESNAARMAEKAQARLADALTGLDDDAKRRALRQALADLESR